MILSLLLITPLLGCLILSSISTASTDKINSENNSKMKKIALFFSILNLMISIKLWLEFDSLTLGYQFVENYNILNIYSFYIGVDGISLYFILLTTLITPICILSNWTDITYKLKYFLISFLLLETLQISVFIMLDLLMFYVFFESVLIPLFFIVGIWGASENRIRASYYLFLYTLAGSLFMLLAILYIFANVGSTDFTLISLLDITLPLQKWLWVAFFISFAIKTPLWPFHVWLPKAHAEAPLAGSILLAAIILKLATYGYLRILIDLLPDATEFYSPFVQTIAIITLIYSSLATMRQIDSKAYVAYSSIAHMAVVLLGLFSNNIQGIEGGILLSIAHGFVSPALFICVGGILYSRYHSRIIFYYKGMALYMPVFTIMFFLFTLFNCAVPLSLNWVGEFLSLAGIFQKSPLTGILGASGIVLSAIYSIWFYNKIVYGNFSKFLKPTLDITKGEFMLLLPLLISTVIFGFLPNYILNTLHIAISSLIYVM